ncbi:MAG: peptidylprolyl isomerase [Saprospiraceae bacterium]|nr:peptidylprolyl isomerase [Saprospiraceae bacterium]
MVHVRHILLTPKITEDDENLAKLKLDSIRNMIAADSITFTEAVKRYGDKASLSFNNGGKLRNPNTGNSFFETKDLDYDTYFAIEDLTVNETTKVMEMKDQRGQKMFRIIQLQSKSKPHKVSIETDYDKIAVYAKESKKAKYFGDWMVEHRKSVFIKIDPMMEGCENLAAYLK